MYFELSNQFARAERDLQSLKIQYDLQHERNEATIASRLAGQLCYYLLLQNFFVPSDAIVEIRSAANDRYNTNRNINNESSIIRTTIDTQVSIFDIIDNYWYRLTIIRSKMNLMRYSKQQLHAH